MKYLITEKSLFEDITLHFNEIKEYFMEIYFGIKVKFELDTITIDLNGFFTQTLKSEFTNNFKGLNLIKKSIDDGFKVSYSLTVLSMDPNTKSDIRKQIDILTNGISYSGVIAENINKDFNTWWILLYYAKVASKEDIQLLWELINSVNKFDVLKYLIKHNNDSYEPSSEFYYIAEIGYGDWIKVKKQFEGLPIQFYKNDILTTKTSKPNEKYHGFILCPKSYIKTVVEIMTNSVVKKTLRGMSLGDVSPFSILETPIKEEGRYVMKYMPINYQGCYDRFKELLDLPKDIENAEGMLDMGFAD